MTRFFFLLIVRLFKFSICLLFCSIDVLEVRHSDSSDAGLHVRQHFSVVRSVEYSVFCPTLHVSCKLVHLCIRIPSYGPNNLYVYARI